MSGIDGAGKSTQIQALEEHLHEIGLHSRRYTFWDDVVAFPRMREFASHKAFRGENGVGSPDKPINRRDKNVNTWYTTAARCFFYLLDALNLRLVWSRVSDDDADFIIFDRYIYDELANLPLGKWLVRLYVRTLLKLSPKPDVAYLIDADPEAARIRKPEYPLEFLRKNREAYIGLGALIGRMKVVGPLSIEETTSEILKSISGLCTNRVSLEFQPQCPVGRPDLRTPNV
ncbi:MAG TPA: thymidylate kinase [Candidatus Sulfotelmatobacter sp.]|nr:thymidylate kinase [Candidatus Sulfotelmatobacter sp.]